jgi:hypothetical protein
MTKAKAHTTVRSWWSKADIGSSADVGHCLANSHGLLFTVANGVGRWRFPAAGAIASPLQEYCARAGTDA